MKGIIAFFKGVSFRNTGPALVGWFFNFLFSLFIYFGYYGVFSRAAGESTIAAELPGKTGIFTFLADISRNFPGVLSLVFFLALLAALLYILGSIFAAAGIYSVFIGDERTTLTNLAASSIENFYPMLKIFLVNLLNWAAALFIPGILLLLFMEIEALALNETVLRVFAWVWAGITVLIFTFSTALYDFARIFKLRDETNVFSSFKKAAGFIFSNKWNILVIFILYGIFLAGLILVYLVFNHFVEDLLHVFLVFIIYQVFILVRYSLKIVAMRAEIELTVPEAEAGNGE